MFMVARPVGLASGSTHPTNHRFRSRHPRIIPTNSGSGPKSSSSPPSPATQRSRSSSHVPGDPGRADGQAGGVGRERGQDDRPRPDQKTRGGQAVRPEDRVVMARRSSSGRGPAGGRARSSSPRPRRSTAGPSRLAGRGSPGPGSARPPARAASSNSTQVRRRPSAGAGDSTRSPATTRRAIGTRPSSARELGEGLGQRVRRQAIAAGAPGPLVAEVDVGDHRDAFGRVDRRAFGGELPAVGAVTDHRGHQPLVEPPQGVGGRLEPHRLRPPGSIQAAANGDGPSSARNRRVGRVSSQARADRGVEAGLRGPRGGSRGAGDGPGTPP